MRAFKLTVVTPDGLAFSGEAESILVRTTDGDVEILRGHADFLATLSIGRTRIIEGGKSRLASSAGGFITVTAGEVKMVATTFEFAEDIDLSRARVAKERAEAKLSSAKTKHDVAIAEAKLKRALNRISVGSER
ncbi:MAG: ATP synthase F1 subunit epsilon [Clostridia bacterium]|nr:ATP synthase F1 subunit epsilon [Clostridia bacterium]